MSSDTGSLVDRTAPGECTYCEDPLSDAVLAVQTYPAGGIDETAGLVGGGLLLCADCATEPVSLVDSWDPRPDPQVSADRPIADGYAEVADACSFCADSLGSGPVFGVECYRRPGGTLPPYANYALCPDCRDVFEEFLANLRDATARP